MTQVGWKYLSMFSCYRYGIEFVISCIVFASGNAVGGAVFATLVVLVEIAIAKIDQLLFLSYLEKRER